MVNADGGLATIARPAFGTPANGIPSPVSLSIVPPAPAAPPAGRPRSIAVSTLLFFATLGLYGAVWAYRVHDELRRDTGRGMGGVRGALLWVLLPPVLAFTLPAEVDLACLERALPRAVRARTGWWMLLPLAGAVVWFVKVQRALNEYWWYR